MQNLLGKYVSDLKNRYSRNSKISKAKFRQILMLFELDTTATSIAFLCNINRNTANRYLNAIRKRIFKHIKNSLSPLTNINNNDIIENLKKSGEYQQIGNNCTLGILQHNDKIYTEIIQIGSITKISLILLELSTDNKFMIKIYNNEIKTGYSLVDSFWNFTRKRLSKFKGINSDKLLLHIKECEMRFNNRNQYLYDLLLKIFQSNPL